MKISQVKERERVRKKGKKTAFLPLPLPLPLPITPSFIFWLSFQFSRGQNRKSRSSVFPSWRVLDLASSFYKCPPKILSPPASYRVAKDELRCWMYIVLEERMSFRTWYSMWKLYTVKPLLCGPPIKRTPSTYLSVKYGPLWLLIRWQGATIGYRTVFVSSIYVEVAKPEIVLAKELGIYN